MIGDRLSGPAGLLQLIIDNWSRTSSSVILISLKFKWLKGGKLVSNVSLVVSVEMEIDVKKSLRASALSTGYKGELPLTRKGWEVFLELDIPLIDLAIRHNLPGGTEQFWRFF